MSQSTAKSMINALLKDKKMAAAWDFEDLASRVYPSSFKSWIRNWDLTSGLDTRKVIKRLASSDPGFENIRSISQQNNGNEMESNEPQIEEQGIKGTWEDLLEKNARKNHTQKFGVEVEFNKATIPYKTHEDLLAFAAAYGHKGIWVHKSSPKIPLEMHFDQISGSAKLEVVSYPPVPYEEFIAVLRYIKTNIVGQKASSVLKQFVWKKKSFNPQHPKLKGVLSTIQNYNYGYMLGPGTQVTTTHTAKELKSVIENTGEQFQQIGLENPIENLRYVSMNILLKEGKLTDKHIINIFFGGMQKAYKHSYWPVKGMHGMLKHAQEQFLKSKRKPDIPGETKADRIKKSTKYLKNLHTQANKLAPVFKRPNGHIAYVIEYRDSSKITKDTQTYLTGGMTETKYRKILKKYLG